MEDTAIKKIIILATICLAGFLWWTHHPRSIKAVEAGLTYAYTVKTQKGEIDNPMPPTPLIIALHGNGDTPSNFRKTLFSDLPITAKLVTIQGPIKYQSGYAWPQSGAELKKHGDALVEIVMTLSAKYPSALKPILIGFSGGGSLAYYHAALYPDLYSTIIPIAGRLDQSLVQEAGDISDPGRIVILHGKQDQVISFSAGMRAADVLTDLGRPVEFIPLPGPHLSIFMSGHEKFKSVLLESIADEE